MTSKPVSLPRYSCDKYAKPQRIEWASKLERLINSDESSKSLWRKIETLYGDTVFILDDLYSGVRPQATVNSDLRTLICSLERVAAGLSRHKHLLPKEDQYFPDTAKRIAEHFSDMRKKTHADSYCERFFLIISDLAIDPWSGPFQHAIKNGDKPKATTVQDCIDLIGLGVAAMEYSAEPPKVPEHECLRGYIKRLRRHPEK